MPHVKKLFGAEDSKVIAFGGSYGGMHAREQNLSFCLSQRNFF
jgi:hypothetical protein